MAAKLTGKDLRMALARLRGAMVEGLNDDEIAERVGIAWEEVAELKRKLLDAEAEAARAEPTEHTYARYVLDQRQCIKELDTIIDDYEKEKNVSAIVGAVRAKSDILDRVLKSGQELGLVRKRAAAGGLAAGEAVKKLNSSQFRQYIVNEMKVFQTLVVRHGDGSLLDLDPGPLHVPEKVAKQPVARARPHARTKVYGGRRVLRDGEGDQ